MTVTKIMKNNLSAKGLSLSQAQSISNLCYQRAIEINNTLNGVNNAEKVFVHNGKDYILEAGKPLPSNTARLVMERARLHATQAFLMSNIKAKDALLNDLKSKRFESLLPEPKRPEFLSPELEAQVSETWGWNQLSNAETNEYLEKEAYAAHIGQFIHKDSPLSVLRAQLPKMKSIDFVELKAGEKTPVTVNVHHTSDELMTMHESLAGMHRENESRVNYFKAKVKNLVTEENARIARDNGVKSAEVDRANKDILNGYQAAMALHNAEVNAENNSFEQARLKDIQSAAVLRIDVDLRFQSVVDEFLKGLSDADAI